MDVCHRDKCLHINSDQFTRNVKHLTRLSLENGIRQTWLHLYVSGSVYNQIHMYLLFTMFVILYSLLKQHEMEDIYYIGKYININ